MKALAKSLWQVLIPDRSKPLVRRLVRRFYYFGFRHTCPFCRSPLRAFLPYGHVFPVLANKRVVGGGYRKNAHCPVCGSRDRERLLYLFLRGKTDLFLKPTKLLHVAPSKSVETVLRTRQSIDYLTAGLGNPNVMVNMDITEIQYSDNSFDAILCNHVLEYIVDDRRAMAELYRVLKPGGWAILQVPISMALERTQEDFSITTAEGQEQAFGLAGHVRLYARDYKDRLKQTGFRVTVFRWRDDPEIFGGTQNRFGLIPDEEIYFVRKD